MGFSRPEYCSGLPCPPPWDLPDPGIKPRSHASPELQVYPLPRELPGKPHTILIRLGLFLPTSSETGLSFFSFSVFHSSIFFIIVVSHLRLFILFLREELVTQRQVNNSLYESLLQQADPYRDTNLNTYTGTAWT